MPPMQPAVVNEPLGISAEGIPLSWRGLLGIEAGLYSNVSDYTALGLTVIGDIPLVPKVFLTTRLPIGLGPDGGSTGAMLGNASIGARGVLRPGRRFWVGLGASLGFPFVTDANEPVYEAPPIPHGLWNFHEYYPYTVPIAFGVDLEGQLDIGLVFRLEIEPVLMPPIGENGEGFEMTLQHAGEFQIGRDIGGGLRLQGVALPTFGEIDNRADFAYIENDGGDLYQFALEPFFRLERDRYMLRTGIMLPMDSQLGPPFASTWGLRLQLGMRL